MDCCCLLVDRDVPADVVADVEEHLRGRGVHVLVVLIDFSGLLTDGELSRKAAKLPVSEEAWGGHVTAAIDAVITSEVAKVLGEDLLPREVLAVVYLEGRDSETRTWLTEFFGVAGGISVHTGENGELWVDPCLLNLVAQEAKSR
jgi:hypothetical protein